MTTVNKDEFIQIISEYSKLIYKICNTYALDKQSRKDLEQEIIIQLWTSLDKFDGRVKLSTWIYRVALNTAINYYKWEKKHQRRSQ